MCSITERFQRLRDEAVSLSAQYNSVKRQYQNTLLAINETQAERETLASKIKYLSEAQKVVQQLIALHSIERCKSIEDIITKALNVIFDDRDLAFEVEITDKRSNKAVNFYLCEKTASGEQFRFPLNSNSVAGGVLVVCAFMLQVYFINYFKLPPFVLLDEAFSQVSDSYLPNLMMFLTSLKEAYGLIIVLISHDPRFTEIADRTYEVREGHYKLVTKK